MPGDPNHQNVSRILTTNKPYVTRDTSCPSWYMHALTAEGSWAEHLFQALFSGTCGAFSGAFSALQVHMTCMERNHKQQQKSWVLFWHFFWRFFWRFPYFATRSSTVMVFNVFVFIGLRKGFTGFTGAAHVAVVVAELVAVRVALVAAVVVLLEVADRLDVDPKKVFGPALRTHSSQIMQSSAQSECFCRRIQRSDSAKDTLLLTARPS